MHMGQSGDRAGESDQRSDPITHFAVGHRASLRKTIERADVDAFAALSGDNNALHIDEEFAARTEFERPVVHGFLHASLLSALIGTKLPGPGALWLSQTLEFTRPVFVGDTVEAIGTVESVDPQTRVLGIKTEIVNQHGERVLEGRATVKVMRLVSTASRPEAKRFASMAELLNGQVALVTGASRGIGRAVAAMLAGHGAIVWVNYNRSRGAAEELAGAIREAGGKCQTVQADVTKDGEVARMVADVAQPGGIDILVNNAGPKIVSASFDQLTWDQMQGAYDNIVGSVFRVTQAALPHLLERRGKIVNVLSTAALGRTAFNWLPYVAAKGALLSLSKNVAQELGPRGVRVNMVSPSIVDTDLVANTPEKVRQMAVSRTPLRRMATVEDVAGAVLFLVSPYAEFVAGDNLLVSGGETML
jgi:3-oxoacyl-[acyl-carrier protein] reductase